MARSSKPHEPCSKCGKLLYSSPMSSHAPLCRSCRCELRESEPFTRQRGFRPTAAWKKLRAQVLSEERHCGICGEPIDFSLSGNHRMGPTVDHIVSLFHGGAALDRANLRAAHRSCNSRHGVGAA